MNFDENTDMFKAGGIEFYIYPDKMAWNRVIESQVISKNIAAGRNFTDVTAMIQDIYSKCRRSNEFGGTIIDIADVCFNYLKPLNAAPQEPTPEESNEYARKIFTEYNELWLDLACLYIFVEGEDETVVDPALNKKKKDIWKKHVSAECFFLSGLKFLPQLANRLKGASISQGLVKEMNEKNQQDSDIKLPN